MKFILTLCFCLSASMAFAQAPEDTPPVEPVVVTDLVVEVLTILQPLPEAVQNASMAQYKVWAELHNELSYERARMRSDAEAKRDRRLPVTVSDNQYRDAGQSEGTRREGFLNTYQYPRRFNQNGSSRTTDRVMPVQRWGGGPVVILNPYVK
jgi:hypothetical protein